MPQLAAILENIILYLVRILKNSPLYRSRLDLLSFRRLDGRVSAFVLLRDFVHCQVT
jgi:hypothetical protein